MTIQKVLSVRPSPDEFAWTFGGASPSHSVAPGTILELFTEDCYAGQVRTPTDLPSSACATSLRNPQTGPFFVEGAEPGDTIAVHFISIEPARDWAVSALVPHFGALTSTRLTAGLQAPLPETVWVWTVDHTRGTCTFHARDADVSVTLPIDPMHGTVGVAPAVPDVLSSSIPGSHGGNLDTPEMRSGVTCYLGVNVPGALFSIGDGHVRQGEGETCGVAVESAMNTVLAIEVVKDRITRWPRIESDSHLMSVGSARPLEDAFRISQLDLIAWVSERCSMSDSDAYQLVSQVVESPIGNVCDANYTCVAKVRKDWLPKSDAVDDVHSKLRASAQKYLQEKSTQLKEAR